MFEHDHSIRSQPSPIGMDEICADYLDSLHRTLSLSDRNPRETRLQRERLSIRFARKVRVGVSRRSDDRQPAESRQTTE